MTRMSTRTGPLHAFTCHGCGGTAATIEVLGGGPTAMGPGPDGRELVLSLFDAGAVRLTFLGTHVMAARPERNAILEADSVDPLSFDWVDSDLRGFCCRRCEENYCSSCWRHWMVPGDAPGYFDGVRGVCPAGHEQELES
jgi:hypothetical protein